MDTLTHIVLGACIGEAIAGKQLGKKALIIGALAQSLPDIDFVASFWLPISADLLAHRGFTHSFTFTLLITPILAWLCGKIFRNAGMTMRHWAILWGLQIFIHQFIDAFNAYGTGWFEPFSHYRVSFNTLFVADPLFTIWPTIAFVALLVLHRNSGKRKKWAGMGIMMCATYLLASVLIKLTIAQTVNKELTIKQSEPNRYFTSPTPLNNLLWYVVAETDSGFFIGYRSVFDKAEHIKFHFAPKQRSLLSLADNKVDADNLIRFSKGYYTTQMWHDTLVFNDLRFGEILGWREDNPKFIFYYYLGTRYNNDMIVQRGRFAKWDKENLMAFIRRIKGV